MGGERGAGGEIVQAFDSGKERGGCRGERGLGGGGVVNSDVELVQVQAGGEGCLHPAGGAGDGDAGRGRGDAVDGEVGAGGPGGDGGELVGGGSVIGGELRWGKPLVIAGRGWGDESGKVLVEGSGTGRIRRKREGERYTLRGRHGAAVGGGGEGLGITRGEKNSGRGRLGSCGRGEQGGRGGAQSKHTEGQAAEKAELGRHVS